MGPLAMGQWATDQLATDQLAMDRLATDQLAMDRRSVVLGNKPRYYTGPLVCRTSDHLDKLKFGGCRVYIQCICSNRLDVVNLLFRMVSLKMKVAI